MHTSILTGSGYMDEVRDGNPQQCFEMFRMPLQLFYHLVDELKQHGYLKEGKGLVDVQNRLPCSCTLMDITLVCDALQTGSSIPHKR